jgi:putative hemolysin
MAAAVDSEILIFLACLLASAFFSGSETALLSASRLRLRRLAADGDAAAQRILDLVHDPRRLLAGILVGNNIVNVLAASAATTYCLRAFEHPATATTVAVAVSTVLLVLFSEFLPKMVAATHPVSFARRVARPISWSLTVLSPAVVPLEAVSRPLGRMLGRKRKEPLGLADVRVAVAEGIRSGAVDPVLARVLRGGLSLGIKTVGDVLVPRVDVVGVDAAATYDQCVAIIRQEKFSRLLVMDGTPDHDLGYLAAKDLAYVEQEERGTWTARDSVREAPRVPESLALPELLARMRRGGVHFAVVKDEYGGTEGIVTLEDVVEEIVGDIRDEHDQEELPAVVEMKPDHRWLVRGDVSVKELHDRLGVNLPAEDARTVGGYVAEALGRVPRRGDAVTFDAGHLTVVRVAENRVQQVRLVKGPPAP